MRSLAFILALLPIPNVIINFLKIDFLDTSQLKFHLVYEMLNFCSVSLRDMKCENILIHDEDFIKISGDSKLTLQFATKFSS